MKTLGYLMVIAALWATAVTGADARNNVRQQHLQNRPRVHKGRTNPRVNHIMPARANNVIKAPSVAVVGIGSGGSPVAVRDPKASPTLHKGNPQSPSVAVVGGGSPVAVRDPKAK